VAFTEQALTDAAQQLTSNGARLVFLELPPALPIDCGTASKVSSLGCRVRVTDDSAQAPDNAMFKRLQAQVPRVSTVSVTDAICPNGVCAPEVNGMMVRLDGLHFTPAASVWLAPVFFQRLKAINAFLGGPPP
jgi:hypothetical protein